MKCNKMFLAGIFLLAAISLGAVCAQENQTFNESVALHGAEDDLDSNIGLFGESQKANIENQKISDESLLGSFDNEDILNVENKSKEDIITVAYQKESDADLPEIDIPSEIIYYSSYVDKIQVTFPDCAHGNVTVLLDGKHYKTADLNDYTTSSGTENEDGTITWRHTLSIPLNIDELTYKSYNITVIYNGDNVVHEISQSGMCKLSYIGLSSDFLIYKESLIGFSAPSDIKSDNFIINIDGKRHGAGLSKYTDDYSCTHYAVGDSYLAVGYHSISIKYPGDDVYPELEYNAMIDVEKSPYCEFALDQNATILYIHTPEWGENFQVSIEMENEDNTTPVLTEHISLADGKASCTLSGLDLGSYVAKVYNGNELIFTRYFSVVPLKINVPEKIYIDNPGSMSAVLPADAIGNMTVRLTYWDDDDNPTRHSEITVPFKNGAAAVDLPKLFKSDMWILRVYCTTENYGNYTKIYDYAFDDIIDDDNDYGIPDDYDGGPNDQINPTLHSINDILKSTNISNKAYTKSYLKTELLSLSDELDTANDTSEKTKNTTVPHKSISKSISENVVEENQNTPIIAIGLLICAVFALLLARKFKS